jgi:hypothetical protein
VGIWIAGGDDLVDPEADENGKDRCRIQVPLSKNMRDSLVKLQHQVVPKAHGGGMKKLEAWVYLH